MLERVQAAWLHKLFCVYLISSIAVVVAGACCTAKAVLLGRLAAVFVEHSCLLHLASETILACVDTLARAD